MEYIPTGGCSKHFLDNNFGVKLFKDNFKKGNYKVKSIATKEQFAEIEYKLEDE